MKTPEEWLNENTTRLETPATSSFSAWDIEAIQQDAIADKDKRIKSLEEELLFANDAASKGDLARNNAAGMELHIAELSAAILVKDEAFKNISNYLRTPREKWDCTITPKLLTLRTVDYALSHTPAQCLEPFLSFIKSTTCFCANCEGALCKRCQLLASIGIVDEKA